MLRAWSGVAILAALLGALVQSGAAAEPVGSVPAGAAAEPAGLVQSGAAAEPVGSVPAGVVSAQDSGFGSGGAGVHAGAVEELGALGVFAGTECEGGGWCWGDAVSREVAAVWLVRVLDGGDGRVPESGDRFVDVVGVWAGHVERLAVLGVTVGCRSAPLRFCPGDPVTRSQMASFLVRAFGLEDAPSAGFGDIAGSVHEGDIDALFAAGVTMGCSQELFLFCPGRATTRAEMATFLNRARGLRDPGTAAVETDSGGSGSGGSGGSRGPVAPVPIVPVVSVPIVPIVPVVQAVSVPVVQAVSVPVVPVVQAVSVLVDGGLDDCGNSVGPIDLPRYLRDRTNMVPGVVRGSGVHPDRRGVDLDLSWNLSYFDGGAPEFFRVRWEPDDPDVHSAPVRMRTTTGYSCLITAGDLGPGQWRLGIAAVNGLGEGEEFQLTVEGTTPSPPQWVTRSQHGVGSVALSWGPSLWQGASPVSGYKLWWRGAREEWPAQPQAEARDASYVIEGLSPGSYFVRVAAVSDAGVGRGSYWPFEVTALSVLPGHTWMDLSWPQISDAQRYVVQWKLAAQPGWDSAEQHIAPHDAVSYPVAGLTADGSYMVRVSAEDSNGNVLWTGQTRTTLGTIKPGLPPRRNLISVKGDHLDMQWSDPASKSALVHKYVLNWRTGGQHYDDRRAQEEPKGSGQSTYDWFLFNVNPNTDYELRLEAVDASGRTLGVLEGSARTASLVIYLPVLEFTWTGPALQWPNNVQVWGSDERVVVKWGARSQQPPSATKMRVEWRSGSQEYSDTRRIETARAETPSADIRGLSNGVDYTVRVSTVDAQNSVLGSAETTVRTEPLADFIEREIIKKAEDDYPWLRHASNVPIPMSVLTGTVSAYGWRHDPDDSLAWRRMYMGRSLGFSFLAYFFLDVFVHELAHHYTMDYRMGGNQPPVAAGWMYFAKLVGGHCSPTEIFADMMSYHVDKYGIGRYLNSCPQVGNPPRAEALAVVASISAGEMPQWFYDTYSSDGTAAAMDLDLLWDDILAAGPDRPWGMRPIAYRFRNSFGGYCSEAEALAEIETIPSGGGSGYKNPWVDGGCETRWPKALSVSGGGSGEIDVSWQEPHYATTPTIDAYVVQWKSGAQDYDSSRQALVTDLSDLSHSITGLVSGTQYTVRVGAVNQAAGTDVFTDDDGHSRAAQTTATAG